MAKLRLCESCGISLVTKDDWNYQCPACNREWTVGQALVKHPVKHPITNGKVYEAGAAEFGGGSKSGRKRKKPPKRKKQISNKYLERS